MSMLDRSILLVEDSPDDAEFVMRAFASAGVTERIDIARDGEEALTYLFGGSDDARCPVLVLLDLNLPKIGGLEVLRRIRAERRTRRLPTVVLSSSDMHEDIDRAYDLGANSYVRKPVEFSEYSKALRQLGQYWLHLNRAAADAAEGDG